MTRILVGDAREKLRELPAESVHCCVTSPPYWGLRSYKGDPGMIGLESTFDEHLERLVEVFREVRRVLRPDGTLWLNYGDAYAGGGRSSGAGGRQHGSKQDTNPGTFGSVPHASVFGCKPKDLMMMPARVAMALQADGWWLRSKVIWHKPNPMPESITDRPTSSYEEMFLLTKSGSPLFWKHRAHDGVRVAPEADYVWRNRDTGEEVAIEPADWRELLSERSTPVSVVKLWRRVNLWDGHDYFYDADAVKVPSVRAGCIPGGDPDRMSQSGSGNNITNTARMRSTPVASHANLRNVWTIPTHSYQKAHFATFPPALVEPCIRAGTSERGVCAQCMAPLVREVSATGGTVGASWHDHSDDMGRGQRASQVTGDGSYQRTTAGWRPSCECGVETVPATCLDPFGGSGTVGLVADRLQRDAVLIEISPVYAQMARERITDDAPLLADVL